uniref:PH domain-containing protein n=1 Tax=Trichobilharzia regenti TaxID=157069 RepID=A0AA85JW04_TRIRE|nr:unnamed protein product [Trichobilharzia regenti]
MRVNSKELGCVSTSWNSSYEGILYWKQKVDSRLKRGCVFSEHWCRLKGNILILCRSPDRTSSEIAGVILLESFTVSYIKDEEIPYSFRLDFDSGDKSFVFIARSKDEAEKWYQHLSKAQLAPKLRRFTLLRDEIKKITGSDPLESGFSSSSFTQPSIEGSLEDQGLEIILKCQNVGDITQPNELPNTCMLVSVSNSQKNSWTTVGATEVIESALIGVTTIPMKELLNNSSLLLPIHNECSSPSRNNKATNLESVPSVYIQSRKQKPLDSTIARVDANMLSLRSVCDNLLSKRYTFQDTLGETMHVVEFMGESKLCYEFPIEYLKLLIQSEYLIYDSLSRTGSSKPVLESLRKERLISLKQTLERYEANLRNLVDYSGPHFKASTERANPRYDFVPVNLHVNQIAITNIDGQIVSSLNIISVGAFSLGSARYKNGGLFRMAFDTMLTPSTRLYPPSELSYLNISSDSPVAASTCLLNTKPIGKAMDLLYRGTHATALLRSDLGGLIERLSAPGQAEPLAQRMQKTVSSIQGILSNQLLSSLNVVTNISCDFEVVIGLLAQLSSLEIMQGSISQQQSNENLTKNKQISQSREELINALSKAGQKLSITLEHIWDNVSSILWNYVLSGLADLSNQQMPSTGDKEAGGNYFDLISEAERSTYPNMLPINNNILTAISVLQDSFSYRHHACVCQLLTTVLTALSMQMPRWNRVDWEQIAVCGVLAQFEGLLSCYGDEQGMIEDWAWAIDYLSTYRITLRPSGNCSDALIDKNTKTLDSNASSIFKHSNSTGNLTNSSKDQKNSEEFHLDFKITKLNECELSVPWRSWVHAPSEIQARGRVRIRLHPVSFLVGINELQSVAETLDKTAVQSAVNNHGLKCLRAYFERYTKHFGAPGKTASNQDVCDLLTDIAHRLTPPIRSKPVEILQLASEVTHAFGGLRVTTCKSAKDRTAMSVTLEQIQWLKSKGMNESCFTTALRCIRSTGLRLDNVMKNTGKRKYAFHRLQLLSFPRLYKPPMGTYSSNVSS